MEISIENASAMSAAQLQAAVGTKVIKISLDAAKMNGTQTLQLIEAAAPPPPLSPTATTGVMLDTFA